jgi:Sec-independent protein translocase protein TatA
LGRSLGKSLAEFKRASNELKNTLEEEIRIEEHQQKAKPSEPARPAVAAEGPVVVPAAEEPIPARRVDQA